MSHRDDGAAVLLIVGVIVAYILITLFLDWIDPDA